ncbi:cilia- and flagella-associated protein 69 [Arapaima gigas]
MLPSAAPTAAPVGKNTAKDDDAPTAEPLELDEVIKLLEDPSWDTSKDRLLFLLGKLLKRFQNGFLLKNLAEVFKVLSLCADKTTDHPEYIPVMCDILQICGLPFLKEKSSDEVKYAAVVKESLSQMGCLMRVPSAKIRLQTCTSIIMCFRQPKHKCCVNGLRLTSPGYKMQMLEQCGIAETLVLSLALLEGQLEVKLRVLHALQMLSMASEVNCRLILKAQGASKMCSIMNEQDPSGQLLFRASEVLWNLLEKGNKEEVTSQLSSLDCILSFKEAFLNQLLNGFRQYDLQLRNDLLVIISLIAENPKAPLIESGLAKELISSFTFPEIKSQNPLLHSFKLSFNYEDYEMKKLLFNIIVVMLNDPCALPLFREGKVLLALFYHMNPNKKLEKCSWSTVQQEELQLQALATLVSVAPLLLDDYMSFQGNTRLLLLLEWCGEQADGYFGQGHCFHGTGGRGTKKAQLRYCLRLLRTMASLANETLNQNLCDQGAITQLLGIIMQVEVTYEQDAVTLEITSNIQLILSALCDDNLHRKELFGSDGVEMTIYFLKNSAGKFYSGLGHNKLIITTVDCVWYVNVCIKHQSSLVALFHIDVMLKNILFLLWRSCIVGCYTTEDLFLGKGGIFLLLDLLESSPRSMQSMVLGTVLELCDNPKTRSHISAWRGLAGHTAAGLLVQLWKEEERELGVKRDQLGGIIDTKKPILSAYQDKDPESQAPLPADKPSAAVLDVMENLRAKIYSIFCKIGFEDLPGLTAADYVTIAIIRKYLDFKVGEVWDEITRELEAEEVRPISPDVVALESIAKATEDKVKMAALEQADLLEQQRQQDLHKEQLLYSEIKFNHKQQELAAKSWEDFLARTSNYKILLESRKNQEASIESSKTEIKDDGSIFHPTQIAGLHVTNFCGRVITVDSTPTHLTGGPLANTDLALERVPIRGGAPQRLTNPQTDSVPVR